ncbi:hypothetical protein LNI94_00480 [Tenacibaculum finnmarkense genomovar ulcerans]|uniref:hypothetical protein n=1 Tax=Tenacibaculum finnmarkense TaxID=2781243 RepID=UPI001E3E941C|nr:hypothetical protein [Tenacibaculum finnmarkense]MCD8421366.1 hypothetical protein [Tenacibaculum finnmarkense genomovar ulcerans]
MKNIITFLILIVFISCGNSDKKREELKRQAEIRINEQMFYKPESHDKWWRLYKPNLINSKGWINENCDNKTKNKVKVEIISQIIIHTSWGYYKGKLRAKVIKTNEEIYFDYKCFIPDLTNGNWLNNKKRK